MKYWLYIICLLSVLFDLHPVYGQKHDFVWLLGYNSDAPAGIEGMKLKFHFSPPEIEQVPIGCQLYISSAMISDQDGQLELYTDGCDIYNTAHEIIENGDSINPGHVHQLQCEEVGNGHTTRHFEKSIDISLW